MTIDSSKFSNLVSIIKNSFRVRANHKPLYVDIGGNIERISAPQHQIVFGRRGSGKSCLFVHFRNDSCPNEVLPIYIMADELKRLTYPDVIIRLLVEVFESLPIKKNLLERVLRRKNPIEKSIYELRQLLDMAEESEVTDDRKTSTKTDFKGSVSAKKSMEVSAGGSRDETYGRTSSFKERKLDTLERHLRDYKNSLRQGLDQSEKDKAYVFVDDFYLFPRESHPDILDYLHRLLRDTNYYMKIGTVRHRTRLFRNHPQTIGVELNQDVEGISLDLTLQDIQATQTHLGRMLTSIAEKAGIDDITERYFNPDALQELTLISGGVPRDFLNIFIGAIEASIGGGSRKWLTPKYIYKGASSNTYNTKVKNLSEDASSDAESLKRLMNDLTIFCLDEKKKTAFLISQDDAQNFPNEHELIQQLMDFKLIHVVEPDTSAASGRPGRYEAYTLDLSLFMEPRRRNIEIVRFWKRDDSLRPEGIREAPIYQLSRARRAYLDEKQEGETPILVDNVKNIKASAAEANPNQGSLFDT